ncbi:MAG TPA: Calx-beta domain-containing protein, partial [Chthoniobacteraceae bacterium]
LNDSAVESLETFTVTLGTPAGGATLGAASTTTVSIVDDDQSVQFAATAVSVRENAGPAVLTVTRSGVTNGPLSVSFATSAGTAIPGPDFTPVNGTLSFAANETSKTITVPIANDFTIEPDESFTVTLSGSSGGAVIAAATATVTIVDEDQSLQFSRPQFLVSEGAGVATLTVTRLGLAEGEVSVSYETTDGTALAGQDYTASSGLLTFADGERSRTIALAILNDDIVEERKSFSVSLSGPTAGATLGALTTAQVQIVDDDHSLQFSAPAVSVSEGIGLVTLTVTRTGLTPAGVTVRYSTSGLTAQAGADFTDTTDVLVFGENETVKTFTVAIRQDLLVESDEEFFVRLSTPTGGATLGLEDEIAVTIVDDDTSLQFSAPAIGVTEGAGMAVLTVTRLGVLTGAVSATYSTANGSAVAGSDYTTTSGVLNFADGQSSAQLQVVISNDSAIELQEAFTVILSDPTDGASIGSPGAATVTIDDDDVTLQFSVGPVAIKESAAIVNLTVTRLGASSGTVSATYATSSGTATAGEDFAPTTGTVTFSAGEISKAISVQISHDLLIEDSESFVVALGTPTGGATLGDPASALVTIEDDDQSVQFSSSSVFVREGVRQVTLTVTRLGVATDATTVGFSTSSAGGLNGARPGIDYMETVGQITFAAGETTRTVQIPIYNDVLQDRLRSFQVALTAAGGGAPVGPRPVTTVTIIDDEPRELDDLNGDGIVDVVVLLPNGFAQVRFGDGAGRFGEPASFAVGKKPLAFLIRDFTGDGVSDIAILKKTSEANKKVGAVLLLENDGTGAFTSLGESAVGKGVSAFRAADLGGSNDLEIAVLNKASAASKKNGAVNLLANTGGGAFLPAVEFTVAKKAKQLRIGDLDGDGQEDLVTQGGKAVSALFNDGDSFAATFVIQLEKAAKSLVIGDFNDDDLADLSLVRKDGVQLVLGEETRQVAVGSLAPLSTKPTNLVVGDFNGDRVLDLASGVTKTGNLALLLGGADALTPIGEIPKKKAKAGIAIAEDFNGDGRSDLVTFKGKKPPVTLLSGAEDILQNLTTAPELPFKAKHYYTCDVNNDALADLVITSKKGQVAVLLGSIAGLVLVGE